jgi:hypothetical protein
MESINQKITFYKLEKLGVETWGDIHQQIENKVCELNRARIQRRYKEAENISFSRKDIFSEVRQHSRASYCFPLELLAKFI